MAYALAIAGGLVVGSFLNVCITRWPTGESVVSPGSHCRRCQKPVRWYDNIPLLSYILLGRRCRACKAVIPLRYPMVELAGAALAAGVVAEGFEPRLALLMFALGAALIIVTFIDIAHRIIPDTITLPSILIGPGAAFVVGHISVTESLAGIVVGGGILWLIAVVYERLRSREGMGLGDVKLLAMIGGLLGFKAALFTLLVSSVVGAVVGLVLMALKRNRLDSEIPFGPFLALAALVYMFHGAALVAWYFERMAV
jgi:leader peptidase (prepilin peptidase)/N-methyltransferase